MGGIIPWTDGPEPYKKASYNQHEPVKKPASSLLYGFEEELLWSNPNVLS